MQVRAAAFPTTHDQRTAELAAETARATTDVDAKVSGIQEQVQRVVTALAAISAAVGKINETQGIISGVLTEQAAVTKAILD